MELSELTPGMVALRDRAREFFATTYESPKMYVEEELSKRLAWRPALRFSIRQYINVFVEPSEVGPYPRILDLKYAEVLNYPEPIAVYAVCPHEAIASTEQRREMGRLQSHGFGLVTVDEEGEVRRLFPAMPLVQVIPEAEYRELLRGLPKKIRQRISEAFEDYKNNPVKGAQTITELTEGMVIQACADAVKKGIVSNGAVSGTVARKLDALAAAQGLFDARAAVGGIREYMSVDRNLNHHWPRSKKKAYQKYVNCRYTFVEGIKKIARFREAMKNAQLSGNLPRV